MQFVVVISARHKRGGYNLFGLLVCVRSCVIVCICLLTAYVAYSWTNHLDMLCEHL